MNRLTDSVAVSDVKVMPLVIIFFKMTYSFGILIFWQKALPTLLRHFNDITPGYFTNRLTNFQSVLGIQRELGITLECNVVNVFFASYDQKKQMKKATGRNRETEALNCDRKQFI